MFSSTDWRTESVTVWLGAKRSHHQILFPVPNLQADIFRVNKDSVKCSAYFSLHFLDNQYYIASSFMHF